MSRVKKKKRGRDVFTCHDEWKCRCSIHDRACVIPVSFPTGDKRSAFVADLQRMGGKPHGKHSEHRCHLCERERQEGRRSGWYMVDPKDGIVKPKIVVDRLIQERLDRKRGIFQSSIEAPKDDSEE
jgi:hypothetical protein